MNLEQLRCFADVMELGSFSAAAQRRNVTQPAVSVQVRRLEADLGVRLVERSGRRATPTAAGEVLLQHVHRIDAEVSAAQEAMAPYASGAAGRVRLGTGPTACIYLLPPVLRAFRRKLPAVELIVSTGNTIDLLHMVEDSRLDVGFFTLPVAGRALEVIPVMQDPFVAITAEESHPLPPVVRPQDLEGKPLVAFEPGAHTHTVVENWFRGAGMVMPPVMALGSVEAIKELVRAGLGCAVLPGMSVPPQEQRRGLSVHPLNPPLERTLGVVLRRDKTMQRGLREMVAALRALRPLGTGTVAG